MKTPFFLSYRLLIKTLLCLLLLENSNVSYSQNTVSGDYSYYHNLTYSYVSPAPGTALSETVLKTGVTVNNYVSPAIALPFVFSYKSANYTSLFISSNGYITLGAAPSGNLYTPLTTNISNVAGVISGFAQHLKCGTNGILRVFTIRSISAPGNSICIIEWLHYRISLNDNNDFNFQIRLNQNGNAIEFRYGTMTTTGSGTAQVGLRGIATTTDINCSNVTSSNYSWNSNGNRTTSAAAPYGIGKIQLGQSYLWTVGSADLSTQRTITDDTTTVSDLVGNSPPKLIRADLYDANTIGTTVSLRHSIDDVPQLPITMTFDSTYGLYSRYHATLPAISSQHAEVVYYENFTNTKGYEINAGHIAYEIGSLKVALSANSESFNAGTGSIALSHSQTMGNVKLRAACSHSPVKITQVTLDMVATGHTVDYPSYLGDSTNKDIVEIRNLSITALDISGFTFIFEPPNYPVTPCRVYKIPKNQPVFYPGTSCIMNIGTAMFNSPNDSVHHFYNIGGSSNTLSSSDKCGFLLKNQNGDIIDAVAVNGFLFDGSQGEAASDWFGIPVASCAGKAGLKRYMKKDHNCATDWMVADGSHLQTIGAIGYLLDSAFQAPVIQWSSPTFGNFTGEIITIPPLNNGTYNFTATATSGSNTVNAPLNIVVHSPIPPVAYFYADKINPFVSETVTFHDTSHSYPTNWKWSIVPDSLNYLNGTTSASQNPQVRFTTPGTYRVDLITGNADGLDTVSKPNYIAVHPWCYSAPSKPGIIADSGGITSVCPGDLRYYRITALANAESYNWTVPPGASIISGQGTASIFVQYNSGFTASGTVSVKAINNCGVSASKTLTIPINVPATPGAISGASPVCLGSTHAYSITAVTNATSYNWTVPFGANIQGANHGTNINVLWGISGGNITVKAVNGCGFSSASTFSVIRNCREEEMESEKTVERFNAIVFPNPAIGKTTIQFMGNENEKFRLQLIDITGRILFIKEDKTHNGINLYELDLSGYCKGIYFMDLLSDNYTQRLKITVE